MLNTIMVKATLILSGLIATGVGIGVLFFPHTFHASAGIKLGDDINLLNEMRSSGGMVLVSGLLILFGAIRPSLTFFALIFSAALYLSYGLSRMVSLFADGVPNSPMLQILALELFIGILCAFMLRFSSKPI